MLELFLQICLDFFQYRSKHRILNTAVLDRGKHVSPEKLFVSKRWAFDQNLIDIFCTFHFEGLRRIEAYLYFETLACE